MTEHLKLSTEDAAGVASWMVAMIIDQVRKGNLPKSGGKS
jgi:hypothetical protein